MDAVSLSPARYILPAKSASFLSSILQHLRQSDIAHRHFMTDLLTIWVQFRSGAHLAANTSVYADCLDLISVTITELPAGDEVTRGSLMSLTYSLWLYLRNDSNVQITSLTWIVAKFTSILNHCTPESELLVGHPPFFDM